MKLQLENIGIIKNATIKFNGLTVIAGENDMGKTTVGKVLFSEIRQYKKMSKHYQSKSGIKFTTENHEINFPIFIDTPDFLSKFNYILILDEPEVHLHPKWQLEYAKFIVSLVKGKIIVLVNSHSPYMIEALKRYGTQAKIHKNFYLATLEGKQSAIKDVTTNISPIFDQLSFRGKSFCE